MTEEGGNAVSSVSDLQEFSPLDKIDINFTHYVDRRKTLENKHMVNGIPDYAFALDNELREKLKSIPGFYSISKKICTTIVSRQIQMINQQGLAVGPNQFPEIYEMGVDCARRLGIGVPNIFVVNDTSINAYTIAGDDVSPIIVLHSGIMERMTQGELKCVIGHECGHIHNQHLVYKIVLDAILNSAKGTLGIILSAANIALMQFWTRAGEITADRAALICADSVDDATNVNKKLIYGAAMNTSYEVNIEALRQQLEETFSNPTRIMEIMSDHPNSIRRVLADKEFEECEVFYQWRPELKKPGMTTRTKEATDQRCSKLVNIMDNK